MTFYYPYFFEIGSRVRPPDATSAVSSMCGC